MRKPTGLQRVALAIVNWIGSPESVIIHTILFLAIVAIVILNVLPFDTMLLIFNTIVSLEAIYLALFNQLAINWANEGIDAVGKDIEEISEDVEEISEDIDEIQEDVDELQEDVEDISEDVEELNEEDAEDETREAQQQKTLADIQNDLRKLMGDIQKLQQSR